jgi:hypothetical protein
VIGFFGSEHGNLVYACLEYLVRRRQANLDVKLLLALARLPGRLDEEDIDIDWAARLFNVPADWSDPEHQTIWVRLLVMEDHKLGAVPPVAMQVLASLSPRLLEWVRVIAESTINNFLFRLLDEFNAERAKSVMSSCCWDNMVISGRAGKRRQCSAAKSRHISQPIFSITIKPSGSITVTPRKT